MKIVMLCEFYNERLEFQENLLTKYYIKHNHQVTVITSTFESVFDYYADRHDKGSPSKTYFDQGAKIIKLKYRYNILHRLRTYTSISQILEDEKPDLIYVHDIMLNITEAVRYKKANPGCKIIMDYHADYSNSGKNWLSINILHGIIRKYYLDKARSHLSRIFPVVPASEKFLREVYKVPNCEMELLPLGADTDLGNEIKRKGEGPALRERLKIPKDDIVIFTGGKLTPEKRTELLIEAFLKVPNDNLRLVIIGDSEDEGYKQSLFDHSAGSPNIRFSGWLDRADVYKYLDMADMAVFPASQSILWQQAISMGLPLIVGDIGHQDMSYLNKYGNIVILKKEDITTEMLQQAIQRLLANKSFMKEMSAGAKKVTEEYLNWDNLILRTLRFNES